MRTDEAYFDRAVGRIRTAMLWLSVGGAAVAMAGWSWRHGVGFLVGALASLANFRWLHHLAVSLGPGGQGARKRVLFYLILRYVLLALVGYVIVKVVGANLAALLLGLLVSAAAVIVVIIYELLYARA